MQLLDLPHELLSYIVHFVNPDILRTLCLTEKQNLHHIARHFLWRNITVIFGTDPNPKPNLFSFNSGRLAAIRSLSVVVDGYLDVSLSSFSSAFALMININHVRVNGGSGPFIRFILENTMASLVTLESVCCDAEPQEISDMISIVIGDLCISICHSSMRFLLGPLTVEDLEVHGPDLDRDCMPIGPTLRRLTNVHLDKLKRLYLVDACRDGGCRDLLHLARALEVTASIFVTRGARSQHPSLG
ncbi:hypothetical protein EDD85DRAFT_865972 [Armillaria nabsnona]|nr:hypothetical protein EDD85DRAFT_865972 [Armillaria nabsnona]